MHGLELAVSLSPRPGALPSNTSRGVQVGWGKGGRRGDRLLTPSPPHVCWLLQPLRDYLARGLMEVPLGTNRGSRGTPWGALTWLFLGMGQG